MTRFLTVFVLLVLYHPCAVFGTSQTVMVGDAVTLPAGGHCEKGKVSWIHQLGDDKTRLVAEYDQGVLKPTDWYKDRIKPVTGGNLSLVFNRTTYNDMGHYEYTCDNSVLTIVQLNILIPSKVSVSAGQNAILRSYGHIKGDERMWLEKDGQLVYERDCASRNVSYGTGGFEGRASTSPDACRDGDLSVTLEGVQQADQGVYHFFYGKDGKRKRGNPAAGELTVRPTAVKTTVNPPTVKPTANKGEGEMWTLTALIITGLVAAFAAAFAAALIWVPLGWCLKSKCSRNVPPGTGGAGSDQRPGDVEMLDSERHPLNHPAVNGGPPAQMIIEEAL